MTLLYYDDVFLDHDTGDHPENKNRLVSVMRRLVATGLDTRCVRPDWEPVSSALVEQVHTPAYIKLLRKFAAEGGGYYDPDTIVSERSFDVALMAAGAACDATERVINGQAKTALCLVRPPGHHALGARAMGFCLLNNVALAAKLAVSECELHSVLIVDWDVHHGNGTQAIFWEDKQVGYFSMHRWPFFPNTGLAEETGSGAGSGTTMNIPVTYGTSRRQYLSIFANGLEEFANRTRPQLIMISAGFDAHADDPIGSLDLQSEDFEKLTRCVGQIADRFAEGRIVSVLEGGYHLDALADCVEIHLRALMDFENSGAGLI